jgi:hypothetical protein
MPCIQRNTFVFLEQEIPLEFLCFWGTKNLWFFSVFLMETGRGGWTKNERVFPLTTGQGSVRFKYILHINTNVIICKFKGIAK